MKDELLVLTGSVFWYPFLYTLVAHITFLLSYPHYTSKSTRARYPERQQAPSAQVTSQWLGQWSSNLENTHCTLSCPEPARPKDEDLFHLTLQFLSVD